MSRTSFLILLAFVGLCSCVDLSTLMEAASASSQNFKASSEMLSNMQHASEAEAGILECLKAVCLLHDSAIDLVEDFRSGDRKKTGSDVLQALKEIEDIADFCSPFPPETFESAVYNFASGSKDSLMQTYRRALAQNGETCVEQAINLVPNMQSAYSAFKSEDFEAFLSEFDAIITPLSRAISLCTNGLPQGTASLLFDFFSEFENASKASESLCIKSMRTFIPIFQDTLEKLLQCQNEDECEREEITRNFIGAVASSNDLFSICSNEFNSQRSPLESSSQGSIEPVLTEFCVADINRVLPKVSTLLSAVLECLKGECSPKTIIEGGLSLLQPLSLAYHDCHTLYEDIKAINLTNTTFDGCVNNTLGALKVAGDALADFYLEEGDYVGELIRSAETGVYALKSCAGENYYSILAVVYFYLTDEQQACLNGFASLGGSIFELITDLENGKPLENELAALQEITNYMMAIYNSCTKLLPSDAEDAQKKLFLARGAENQGRMLEELCTPIRFGANAWRIIDLVVSDEPTWLLVYELRVFFELVKTCV